MDKNIFYGSIPAVITPFNDNDSINFEQLKNHIEFLISNGSNGLVSCGTTGESPTLDHDEHKKVTEKILKYSKKNVPVIAGCGSNSTKESIELTKHAESIGVDGILLVSPYYNKPSQRGLYLHFKTIAESTKLPIFLYNIPGRSIVNIEMHTMSKLSKIENIIGVKDATSDLSLPMETIKECGKNFIQLSGEDSTFLSFLANGGEGCISVTANVAPKLCSELYQNWKKNNFNKAMQINQTLHQLNKVLFLETSPAPVKYALNLMNKCNANLRLPLVEIEDDTKKKVKEVLISLNLI